MDPSQIEPAIAELENRLERLRVLYEQYFMGIERRPPEIPRKDVERRAQELRRVRFQNTASRFRFQTIVQRYNTLQQYWNRTCRDIENGTYRRHIQRAERRFASIPPDEKFADEVEVARDRRSVAGETEKELSALLDQNVDLEREMREALSAAEKPAPAERDSGGGILGKLGRRAGEPLPASPVPSLGKAVTVTTSPGPRTGTLPRLSMSPKPAGLPALDKAPPPQASIKKDPPKKGPPPAPSLRPQGPAGSPTQRANLSEDRLRAIHQSYLDARKQTNATAVSYEKLERSIRETERKLLETNKGRSVDFEVSIKDGKAILKPRLK